MKFTTPEDFLHQNYGNLHTTPEVEKAVDRSENPKEQKPRKKISAYLDRIENALEHKPDLTHKILEKFIIDDFVLDTNDEELMLKLAKGLYESEKIIAVERGQTNQIQQLEQNDSELLNKYKEAIVEKAEIQKNTIKSWIDYLKSEDANYPLWFKYFVFRSLKQMGSFERDDISYGKRTETTIAPFPELNSEALGFVRKSITDELDKKEKQKEYITDENPRQEELLEELNKRLQGKNFAKLYAFAQVECAGNLNRESLQGEWIPYKQGSDYTLLEKGLKGKGTGWCTAEGSAKGQIENGDFYVYYTNNKGGVPTEPRIAIRMQNNNGTQQIAEIRGVNKRQELEPELVNKAKEFYKDLPGAEKYEKADHDMKLMTEIYKKCFKTDKETGEKIYLNSELSKEELSFLYELDSEIQSFGYGKDLRVEELRNQRNTKKDLSFVLDCEEQEIGFVFNTEKFYYNDDNKIIHFIGNIDVDYGNLSQHVTLMLFSDPKRRYIIDPHYEVYKNFYLPKHVHGILFLNKFKSIRGMILPESVSQDVVLTELDSIEGLILPKKVGGHVYFKNLPLDEFNKLKDLYPNLSIKNLP